MLKVSVIIPIYCVEKYIERCARSLFEQTLNDVEYIFVNDCTPDQSINILEKIICDYPSRKNNVSIINHEINLGLPIARQTGLKKAKGEYIIHCDSDDWLALDALEKMYNVAKNNNSDMVICDFFTSDGVERKQMKGCYNTENIRLINDFFKGKGFWCVWNKMVRRSVYNNTITYPKFNVAEDMVLVTQLLYYCKNINYIDLPLYYYFKNPQSMTRIPTEKGIYNKFCQAIINFKIVNSFINTNLSSKIEKDAIVYAKFKQRALLMPLLPSFKYYLIWLKTYPELTLEVLFNSYINSMHKIKFYLAFVRLYKKRF